MRLSKKVTKLWQSSARWCGVEGVTGASRGSGDWSLAVSQGRGANEGRECTGWFVGVDKAWVDGWRETLERAVQLPVVMSRHCLSRWPLKH